MNIQIKNNVLIGFLMFYFFSCATKRNEIKNESLSYDVFCNDYYFKSVEIKDSFLTKEIEFSINLYNENLKHNPRLKTIGIIEEIVVNDTFTLFIKITNDHDFIKSNLVFENITGVMQFEGIPFYFFSSNNTFFTHLNYTTKVSLCYITKNKNKFIYPTFWQINKYLIKENELIFNDKKYEENHLFYIK